MKILVLMPLDERYVYLSSAIYKGLDDEVKKITFAIPMFADYLRAVKYGGEDSNDWLYPTVFALYSANKMCSQVKKDENLIIIGNVSKDYELSPFDLIFNFQDDELKLTYDDKFLIKAQEICKDEEPIMKLMTNIHKAEESLYPLTNCGATAILLTELIKSNKPLEELKAKYEKLLNKVDNIKIKK